MRQNITILFVLLDHVHIHTLAHSHIHTRFCEHRGIAVNDKVTERLSEPKYFSQTFQRMLNLLTFRKYIRFFKLSIYSTFLKVPPDQNITQLISERTELKLFNLRSLWYIVLWGLISSLNLWTEWNKTSL